MRFVLTGCPRSGTRYSATLLETLGVPCTHEQVFRPLSTIDQIVKWGREPGLRGESSWMAWTVLDLLPEGTPVFRIVRDPWRVVDSLAHRNAICNFTRVATATTKAIRDVLSHYLPGWQDQETRVNRAAALVLGWNRLIVNRTDCHTVCIDTAGWASWSRALSEIGVERTSDEIEAALGAVRKNVNSGYAVEEIPKISNPGVEKWILEYARQQGCGPVFVRGLTRPREKTPEELAADMEPQLLEEVNRYASQHGYATVNTFTAV